MSYDLPEGTAHSPSAPWNQAGIPATHEECADCFDCFPVREMYERERYARDLRMAVPVYLCFCCVPKCGYRADGGSPACLEVLEDDEGACLTHAIAITERALAQWVAEGDTESAQMESEELFRLQAKKGCAA